ncbi:MAG TPA: SDR family oxidoreductase [Streptosporangiales bacterium]
MTALVVGGRHGDAVDVARRIGRPVTWVPVGEAADDTRDVRVLPTAPVRLGNGKLDLSPAFAGLTSVDLMVLRVDDFGRAAGLDGSLDERLARLRETVLAAILPVPAVQPALADWCRLVWVVGRDAVAGTTPVAQAAAEHAALGAMREITRELAARVSTAALVTGAADGDVCAEAVAMLADEGSAFYTGQILRLGGAAGDPDPVSTGRATDAADGRPAALVTGGAAGMGREHVRALLAAGWRVCVVDRDAAGLDALAAHAGRDDLATVVGDLRQEATWQEAVAEVRKRYGRVDGLVNNAGYGLQRPLAEHRAEDVLDQLAIHVEAAIGLTELLAEDLAATGGAVVNVSSTYALAGPCTFPNPPTVAYCAAKSAVIGVTRASAHLLAPRVRVNAIAPGGARTEVTLAKYSPELLERKIAGVPAGRWAEPREYAVFSRYLLSRRSAGVTGQVLSPNGGEVIGQS